MTADRRGAAITGKGNAMNSLPRALVPTRLIVTIAATVLLIVAALWYPAASNSVSAATSRPEHPAAYDCPVSGLKPVSAATQRTMNELLDAYAHFLDRLQIPVHVQNDTKGLPGDIALTCPHEGRDGNAGPRMAAMFS